VGRLKVASIAIAAVSLVVSIFMWAQLSGIEYGFFYGVFQDPPNSGFAAHGPNYYQSLNIWYFWISLCLSIVIIAKFFRHTIIGGVISILLLAFSAISTWNMTEYKQLVIEVRGDSFALYNPYPWLNSSIYFDWLLLFAFIVLLVIEISTMRAEKTQSVP
jgi:hypothetical protein